MRFFGRLLWILTTVILLAVSVDFAISNHDIISLSLWPVTQNLEIPMWLFGVGTFVIGGILGAVLMGGQMVAIRAKLWRAQSQIKKLDKQATQATKRDTNQASPPTLDG